MSRPRRPRSDRSAGRPNEYLLTFARRATNAWEPLQEALQALEAYNPQGGARKGAMAAQRSLARAVAAIRAAYRVLVPNEVLAAVRRKTWSGVRRDSLWRCAYCQGALVWGRDLRDHLDVHGIAHQHCSEAELLMHYVAAERPSGEEDVGGSRRRPIGALRANIRAPAHNGVLVNPVGTPRKLRSGPCGPGGLAAKAAAELFDEDDDDA